MRFEKGSTPQKKVGSGGFGGRNNVKRFTQVFPGLLPFHKELLAHQKSLPTTGSKGSTSKTMSLPVRVQQSTPYIEELVPRDVAGRVDGVLPIRGGGEMNGSEGDERVVGVSEG